MNVKEMMLKYPEYKYSLFTPGGYVYLTPEEVKSLLSGNAVSANPGCSGYDREMEADELLPGQVMSVRWEGGVCYMMVTKLSDMSDNFVVIMRYSSVSLGKRSTNGRMTEP